MKRTATALKRLKPWVSHPAAPVALIFLLALAARLAQIAASPENALYTSDAESYHRIAINLSTGNGFSDPFIFRDPPLEDGRTAWRAPLFPAIVAVVYRMFGPHPLLAVYLQSLASAATAVMVYWLALEVWRWRRVAVIAGVLTAVFGPLILMNTILMPATLFIFLVTLAVLLVLRASDRGRTRHLLGAGAVLGLAALTKPEGAGLALLLVIWLMGTGLGAAVRRSGWSRAMLRQAIWWAPGSGLVVGLVFAAVLAPWTVRNFLVFGEFIPLTTTSGWNLWAGNNPYTQQEINQRISELRGHLVRDGRVDEPEQDRAFRRDAISYIRAEPGAFLRRVKDRYQELWRRGDIEERLKLLGYGMLFKPVYYLGFLGMALALTRPWRPSILWLPILFFPLLYSIVGQSLYFQRWRLVVEPFWILFAAYAIALAFHGLRSLSAEARRT